MLRVQLLAVGKLKEGYLKQAVAEYSKRLSRYVLLSVVELDEGTVEREGEEILRRARGKLIALDPRGKMLSSEELAQRINALKLTTSEVTFVIGGSNGLSNAVREASEMISFSALTFPHQLFRVMLLEQIYRAETINNNMPYHK